MHRKYHALRGNLLALFVFDILEDAIQDIAAMLRKDDDADPVALLARLEEQESDDFVRFWQSDVPDSLKAIVPNVLEHASIDWDLLVKGPAYCHISVTPTEIRRKGILTESKDQMDIFSMETGALSRGAADASSLTALDDGGRSMQIAFESAEKDPTKFDCTEQLHIDFKEYFYVNFDDGWKNVVVPNDAEVKEYGVNEQSITRGVIAFCLKWCNWNKCPERNMDVDGILAGNATIEVNGQRVEKLTRFHTSSQECVLTSHAGGRYWAPNPDGRFDIRARVTRPKWFLRFTSFVVWYHTEDDDDVSSTMIPEVHKRE